MAISKTFLISVFSILLCNTSALINIGNRTCHVAEGKIPVHIRSIMTRENAEESAEFSVMLEAAANHVNNMEGILTGYHLCFRYDHAGGTEEALSVFYDYVYMEPPILMIFGPPYSSVSTLLNPVVGQYNIVQVTSATSSLLKDRTTYPYTVQIYPVADDINPGRVGIIKAMNWTKIAIVFQDNDYFRANIKNLIELLDDANITILTIEAVSDTDNPDQHILSLLSHDARIIILAFYDELAMSFACKAYQYGLYGPEHVLILPGWFLEAEELWHDFTAPCDIQNVIDVYDTSLYVHTIRTVDSIESLYFNGLKPSKEQEEFLANQNAYDIIPLNIKRIYYDGIMLMALALNKSIEDLQRLSPPRRLEDFKYQDTDMVEVFNKNVRHAEFTGISGLMKTNITRDTSGMRLYISQYRDKQGELIMYMDRDGKNPKWLTDNVTVRWKGGFVPVDGKTHISTYIQVNETTSAVIFAFTSFGIVLAVFFLIFNVVYRNEKVVKMTSPALNTIIVIGCIAIYSTIFMMGVDHSKFTDNKVSALCHTQYALISVGFTLAMGAVFVKTYRVHAIFTNSRKGMKVIIPDSELISWILGLLTLDIVICVVWITADRMYVADIELQPKLDTTHPEKEFYNVPVIRQCESKYEAIFLSILAVIKGVLLVFGVFLAWKTRNVAISSLNDSKYIAFSVYTTAIVVILLIPALTVTTNDVEAQFILIGFAVVFTISVVLLLVFLPKG
ncbi:gamma-aminobutyric acid type B receptor subunit 2-like [Amphiura filiformis]|uniref:gamma-aminobutyric acid type B receptor subunit 2-like n=1 Tax=Amphiura filiformis TaxID=82378 RepID=UPI003B210429